MDTILDIARYLRSKSEREYVMFVTGIYSGLRISDILKLRVRDIRGKDHISIREKKTGKEKENTKDYNNNINSSICNLFYYSTWIYNYFKKTWL